MKRTRFSVEQIVAGLKQAELGMAVPRHANLPLTYLPVPDIA
jgi:hypothetical protein